MTNMPADLLDTRQQPIAPLEIASELASLAYLECRLLDEGHLEEWLELFAEDGIYSLPLGDGADPTRGASLLRETVDDLKHRVYQLLHTPHYAQRPRSLTVHQLTNLEAYTRAAGPGGEGAETALLHAALAVHEVRPGDVLQRGLAEPRVLAGRVRYTFRKRRGERWMIAEKAVLLLSRQLPIENLTFLV